jgi:hypothetical protein
VLSQRQNEVCLAYFTRSLGLVIEDDEIDSLSEIESIVAPSIVSSDPNAVFYVQAVCRVDESWTVELIDEGRHDYFPYLLDSFREASDDLLVAKIDAQRINLMASGRWDVKTVEYCPLPRYSALLRLFEVWGQMHYQQILRGLGIKTKSSQSISSKLGNLRQKNVLGKRDECRERGSVWFVLDKELLRDQIRSLGMNPFTESQIFEVKSRCKKTAK